MNQRNSRPSGKEIVLFLAALILVTGTVHAQESDNGEDIQFKVIQLSPNAGSTDIFVDGEKIGDGLEFGDLASIEIESGTYQVRAESDEIDIFRTVNLQQDSSYTLAIHNRALSPDTTLLSHDTTESEDQTRVRFAHFSPDLLSVNIDMQNGNEVITRNLSYLETGNYVTVSPGNYTVEVTEPRIGGTSFSRQVRLRPDTTYTAFIGGLKRGPTDQGLRVIPVGSRLESQIDEDNDNGNGNGDDDGDNGDTENGEEIRQDFSLVCRFEDTSSDQN